MKNPIRKGKILGLALLCLAVCAGGAITMMKQSNWHQSQARIVAITLECGMRARQGDYVYTKDLPCEMVETFKLVHADKTWSVTERYKSTVQFAGADGAQAKADMTLYARDGRKPQVGDTLVVLQNPQDSSQVERAETAGMTLLIKIGAGMLGAAILVFLFRGKPAPRKKPTPANDDAANENERNARADAMIAAALARQKTEKQAAPPPMVTRVGAPAARAGFGRKR